MGARNSYGEQLRQARLRRGMDIHSVSRRLRIRLDILHAIEEANFAQMPPSGYTRNMITSYARLVGLDPREVSEAYLDELYRFETGRGRDYGGAPSRTRPAPQAGRSSSAMGARRPAQRSDARNVYERNGTQRIRYNAYEDYASRPLPQPQPQQRPQEARRPRAAAGGRSQRATRGAASQRGSIYDRDLAPQRGRAMNQPLQLGQYAPATLSRRSSGGGLLEAIMARLPIILIGAVVLVLIIVVISMAFGGERQGTEEVPSVPISGLTDTSGQSEDDYNVATAVAPTSATLTVTVEDGERSWISVYVNDAEEPEFSEVMEGGEKSFSFTQSIRVVAGNPTPVSLQVDGESVEMEKTSSGSWAYSAKFSDILAAWEEKHGTKSSSSSAASANTTSSSSSSSSSSS